MDAFWRYYLDINVYNLFFSVIISLYLGVFWFLIIFASVGLVIGNLVFSYFKKEEYYFYYNLGYTQWALLLKTWKVNLILVIPGLLLYFLIANLI